LCKNYKFLRGRLVFKILQSIIEEYHETASTARDEMGFGLSTFPRPVITINSPVTFTLKG
jgi:hypothetical protein